MFAKYVSFIAGFGVFVLGATAQAATLSGRVTGTDGTPMEGAMVTVADGDQAKSITLFTGRHGTYSFQDLPSGEYVVRARRLGYLDQVTEGVAVHGAVARDFSMKSLSPEGWAAQAPASVWAARVELDDPGINAQFRLWCMMCHQQGYELARWPENRENWYEVFDRMAHKSALLTGDARVVIADALLEGYHNLDDVSFATPPSVSTGEAGRMEITEWRFGQDETSLHDVTVGPDGRIYAADSGLDTFWRLDPKTDKVERFDLKPFDPDHANFMGFSSTVLPHSAISGPEGGVWMTLALGNQVIRIDPETDEVKHFDVPSSGHYPHTMRFDQEGIMWFTVAFTNHLGRLDPKTGDVSLVSLPTRNFFQWVGAKMPAALIALQQATGMTTTSYPELFPVPYGIDVAADGAIWVSQFNNRRMVRYEPKTGNTTVVETPFSGPRRFRIDSKGTLWIPAYAEGRIYRYDPGSDDFTPYDLPTGKGDSSYALAVNPHDDTVWACGSNSDTVMHLDPADGSFVTYQLPTHVTFCRELDFDEEGAIWTSYSNYPTTNIEGGSPVVVRLRPLGPESQGTAVASIGEAGNGG
jgi:virginiamycin B lyase